MTQEQIDRLSELCEKATPGPWDVVEDFYIRCVYPSRRDPNWKDHICRVQAFPVVGQKEINAEFIAESRTAIPELISHVKDLHSVIRAHTDAALRLQSEIEKEKEAHTNCKIIYTKLNAEYRKVIVSDRNETERLSSEIEKRDRAIDKLREQRDYAVKTDYFPQFSNDVIHEFENKITAILEGK